MMNDNPHPSAPISGVLEKALWPEQLVIRQD
jgi:hypothetical protein